MQDAHDLHSQTTNDDDEILYQPHELFARSLHNLRGAPLNSFFTHSRSPREGMIMIELECEE